MSDGSKATQENGERSNDDLINASPTPNMMMTFDRAKFEDMQAAYISATSDKKLTFWFDGQQFSTAYAKYFLEYLDGRLD